MSSSQTWDPERYARNARFVSDLASPVVELLEPRAGERILDLGCGDGVLTAKLVAMGCHVIGVDASAAQVAAAKKLGVDARVIDGERLQFEREFDAVFSNAALHWMRNPDQVIAGVQRALRSNGRFVGEFGGHANVETIKKALVAALKCRGIDGNAVNPWFYPTTEEYAGRLTRRGFVMKFIELIPRPTTLPGNMTAWLETFAESFIARLPRTERAAYLAEVQEALRPALCDRHGQWTADYVSLRFAAEKRS
jgi:SAM-dependent methyltransferase